MYKMSLPYRIDRQKPARSAEEQRLFIVSKQYREKSLIYNEKPMKPRASRRKRKKRA